MRGGGAMIAIRLRDGYAAARRVTGAVRLFTHAVSLGGVDSLVQHPAALTHRPVAAEARPGADIVRLSIGLEDAEDLIGDLAEALSRVAASGALIRPVGGFPRIRRCPGQSRIRMSAASGRLMR